MVGIDNLDYIHNLPAFEVINLAMELGFINSTGKMRLTHANEIVQHYLGRDVTEEMPQNESDSVIRPCIQYILGYEDSNIQIEYTDFRTSLKIENLVNNPAKLESLNTSPYFYKKQLYELWLICFHQQKVLNSNGRIKFHSNNKNNLGWSYI